MKLGYLSRRKKRQIWETWEENWDSFWEVPDLKLKDYFKRIYDMSDKNLYYPSRKNTGIFNLTARKNTRRSPPRT